MQREEKYLSIIALTRYLKNKFDSDMNLRTIYLKGEISNFKAHTTGHQYFTLKDEHSRINAIMFGANAKKLAFRPTDGMKVLVTGRISVYESTGNYQIYVEEMLEDGVGNLYIAFEQLKEKLAAKGMFDSKYKKPIPKIPSKIGIVTAATGAAIKDILTTLERRFPFAQTYLFPCLVQGEYAKDDIVKKLKQADEFGVDVIILGRGGGSIEDLWPFNEEIVANSIFEAKTPIISAVGHEIDFTISDFVADLRAPTPTGAAEMSVPNRMDLVGHFHQLQIRLNESLYKKLNFHKFHLETIKNSYVLKNPEIIYENKKQRIDSMIEKLNTIMYHRLEAQMTRLSHIKNNRILLKPESLFKMHKTNLSNIIDKLELINPLSVLKRGYNLAYTGDILIKSVNQVQTGDTIHLTLYDGSIEANVITIKEKENNHE